MEETGKKQVQEDSDIIHDPNNYWEQLERLEKLIRASELKAGVIFSFHSLVIGLFVDRLEYFQGIFKQNIVFVILTVIWILFVLISIYYCFRCFTPRLELKYDKNVFFFRDAAYAFGDVKEYSKKLMKVCSSEHELYYQLSQQIHIESKIIDQKFSSVQKSLRYFAFSFISVILIIIFWAVRL